MREKILTVFGGAKGRSLIKASFGGMKEKRLDGERKAFRCDGMPNVGVGVLRIFDVLVGYFLT